MSDVDAVACGENSTYEDWFEPPPASERPHPVIAEAEQYVSRTRIEEHEFFRYAAGSRYALIIWVTQELMVTGPFAQCMLYVASLLRNVHSRSRMTAAAWGEHSPVRDGVARGAHPWLLHQLRESMGISRRDVHALPMTDEFLRDLRSTCADPLRGVAAIGVGNERLIIPEYNAVKSAFAAAFPTSAYEPFLDANISEDGHHARLLQEVAACLIAEGGDPVAYLEAARLSVDSRVTYYDRLLEWVGQCGEEIVGTSGSVFAMAPRGGG
jgi:Iron-containing redox enzyme